jgi:hypothetical protein
MKIKIISPEKNDWWGRSPSKSKQRLKKKEMIFMMRKVKI